MPGPITNPAQMTCDGNHTNQQPAKYHKEPNSLGGRRTIVKNSKTCPKCQFTEIIRIPGNVGAFGAGNNISVGATIFSAVKVTRYLCASCGFSEEWIDSTDDISSIKKRYS